MYFVTGTGQQHRVINLKSIVQALGSTKVAALPALHALSGADITGSFAGKGKVTWWKIFKEADEETITALSNLGKGAHPTADILTGIEKLVCQVYVPNTSINSVKELRWWLFRKKKAQSENLPPTRSTSAGYQESQLSSICVELGHCTRTTASLTRNLRLEVGRQQMGTRYDISASCTRSYHPAGKVWLCEEQVFVK